MRTITAVAALLILLSGCASTTKGTSDYDPATNFAGYQTYAWISEHPMIVGATAGRQLSPLLEGRIMSAISDSLSSKGFRRADNPEQADFVIAFTVGARDEIQVTSYPSAYRGAWGRPGYWGTGYYGTDIDVRQYTEGRLSIDVFDRAEHRPVWHGWATKRITRKHEENPEPAIREVVSAILANFPPA
jgi:hypothetical protein